MAQPLRKELLTTANTKKEGITMAEEKNQRKRNTAVTPWRPFMGLTGRETWIGCWTIFLAESAAMVAGTMV